ncbi:MAG: hypothetical protein IJ938_02980 [Clostridia bacterium]|nr:hypothetical protein [Clostridia bacterium]
MQINSYSYLQNYALDQWTRDLPIRANRGEIYDRNGVILATNQTSYDIYIRPRMVENDEYTAQTLSQVLGKDKRYRRLLLGFIKNPSKIKKLFRR